MTTKDWIYLGLMALTALAFYCNGFYAGVLRSRKVYEDLLQGTEAEDTSAPVVEENHFAGDENSSWYRGPVRQTQPGVPRRISGGFQNN